ncbi:T9SS type A sorting domain-containing protein [Flavobacterium sp. NST-5]|uniref:T9SS type A sorting domain-containing protein n=1 Tax=Flavobacterium ichthyis TaxID=2698827 RepID=A0ABW9Z6J0_9FLAO|nr:T9SS type A sorting domain-containing protein [Flavobacterium ichthyis]NBL64192.1 T9SS type A sorting domain-containing protein [Flavobacterium ichthyis]
MKKILLLLCLSLSTIASAQIDYGTPVANNGSTSQNGRAPQGATRYARSIWIVTAAEMAAAGFVTGDVIQGIGFNYSVAQAPATSASFTVYMQNTADATNLKSTTWATAITGMTTVHNSTINIPAAVGTFDIPFTGGSPFTYTGGGLYIAFDQSNATGALATTPSTALCLNTLVGGLKGAINDTAAPTTVAASNFRPETRLAKIVSCVRPGTVSISASTETTGTLNWVAATTAPGVGYEYYVTSSATPPTSATPATGSVGATVYTAEATGLMAGTVYYAYVRSRCNATDVSAWTAATTFSTTFAPAAVPYAYGFEVDGGWTLFNAGAGNNWGLFAASAAGVIPTAAEGNNYAGYQYNAAAPANAWLFSRRISMNAGVTYDIAFKYRVASATYPEGLIVKIGNDATVAAQTTELFSNTSITTTTWTQATASFTAPTTGSYNVGFNCVSAADMYLLAVDDFAVTLNLSNEKFTSNTLTVHPNPSNGIINISNSADVLLSNIAVMDINGRTVKNVSLNNVSEAQINISDLSAGVYMMNISSDQGTVTKKIVKN